MILKEKQPNLLCDMDSFNCRCFICNVNEIIVYNNITPVVHHKTPENKKKIFFLKIHSLYKGCKRLFLSKYFNLNLHLFVYQLVPTGEESSYEVHSVFSYKIVIHKPCWCLQAQWVSINQQLIEMCHRNINGHHPKDKSFIL